MTATTCNTTNQHNLEPTGYVEQIRHFFSWASFIVSIRQGDATRVWNLCGELTSHATFREFLHCSRQTECLYSRGEVLWRIPKLSGTSSFASMTQSDFTRVWNSCGESIPQASCCDTRHSCTRKHWNALEPY